MLTKCNMKPMLLPAQLQQTTMSEELFSHPGFSKLCEALSVFNPFEVLGLETYELRHTKTLAWLLDPKGSHNLGTAFIERFLQGLPAGVAGHGPANLDEARVFSELPVRNKTLMLGEASSPEVAEASEKDSSKRIDVYVQVDSTFFLAIEAKIGANEHGDQLQHYREAVQKQAGGSASATTLLLYLTLDGAAPAQQAESDAWTAISWSDHVLAPLLAMLQAGPQAGDCAGQRGPNVMHFLSDYLRTLQKVTGSRDFAPRVLAEDLLKEEDYEGPIGSMLKTFHGQNAEAKARLELQLKGVKGGLEAAQLLQAVESDLRGRVCDRLASQIVRDDWVRIGSRAKKQQRQSAASTKIDFVTPTMAKLMGTIKPRFFFRLDIRRANTIELKLFYEDPQCAEDNETLPSPQRELMTWPVAEGKEEWAALTGKNWNLGQKVPKDGIGQKMALMTFGGAPKTIVRPHPEPKDIEQVQDWLAKVVRFVDRKIDAMSGAAPA